MREPPSFSSTAIVLIHELWVTLRCWEDFRQRFEMAGCTALTPAWPGISGETEDMWKDPSALKGIGVVELAEHYERPPRQLPKSPMIMGHSFGGLIVQMLLGRGLGAAGVAISSAPPGGYTGSRSPRCGQPCPSCVIQPTVSA